MKTDKIQLIDFFTIIIRRRKLFLVNMASVGLIALLITLFLPKWYESKAIVLPPMTESLSFGLGSLSSLAGAMMGPSGYELPMLATRSDVYKTMLESRRMYKTVIEQNDLYSVYKEKNLDLAIRKLKKNLKIDVGPDASLSISFEAKENPEFAAQVANSFVSTLDRINTQTLQNKARDTRQFIEGRLDEAKVDLANAEIDFSQNFSEDIISGWFTSRIKLYFGSTLVDSEQKAWSFSAFRFSESFGSLSNYDKSEYSLDHYATDYCTGTGGLWGYYEKNATIDAGDLLLEIPSTQGADTARGGEVIYLGGNSSYDGYTYGQFRAAIKMNISNENVLGAFWLWDISPAENSIVMEIWENESQGYIQIDCNVCVDGNSTNIGSYAVPSTVDLSSEYYVYIIEWNENYIKYYFNGNVIVTTSSGDPIPDVPLSPSISYRTIPWNGNCPDQPSFLPPNNQNTLRTSWAAY
ncbi:family 16 glycosylhydrolase [candidate division KSB1 bacterium]|nr:family 16 glycosylhydrolase [candidate division KSB1 bacterium]